MTEKEFSARWADFCDGEMFQHFLGKITEQCEAHEQNVLTCATDRPFERGQAYGLREVVNSPTYFLPADTEEDTSEPSSEVAKD